MPDTPNFTLTNNNEITRKLTLILKKNSLLTVTFNDGKSFFISALLEINTKKQVLHLDIASDPRLNKQLLKAKNILFETSVAGVAVSFTLNKVTQPLLGGKGTFILDFPKELIWLERRMFYRIKPPIQNTPTCQLSFAPAESSEVEYENFPVFSFEINDISLTGLSLLYNPEEHRNDLLADISNIHNFTVHLPDIGSFETPVEIRNRHPQNTSAPEKIQIIGIKFQQLPSAIESKVQRYLLSVERSRNNKR